MRRSQLSVFVVLVPVVLLGAWRGPSASGQDSPPAEWLEVKAAIERRRATSMLQEYAVEAVIVLDSDPIADQRGEQSGPVTYEATMRYVLDFEHGLFRLEERTSINSKNGRVPHYSVYLFDGTTGALLHPDAQPGPGKHAVMVSFPREELLSEIAQADPIFWRHGIFDVGDFLTTALTDLSASNCSWGSDHNLLTVTQTFEGAIRTIVFDRKLDWNVVQSILTYTSGGTFGNQGITPITDSAFDERTDIGYELKDGGLVLRDWELSFRGVKKSYRASRVVSLASVALSDFQTPKDYLKEGDIVSQNMKPPFKVTKAGTLTPWRPKGKPLEPSNRTAIWVITSAVILLSVLTAAWMSRGRAT